MHLVFYKIDVKGVAKEIIEWVHAGPRASRPHDSSRAHPQFSSHFFRNNDGMLHNKRTDPMRKETIDMLQKFYRPQNKRLEELLGVPMGWDYNWRESKNSTKTIEYCIHQQQFSVTRSTTSSHRGSWIIMVLPKYFKDSKCFKEKGCNEFCIQYPIQLFSIKSENSSLISSYHGYSNTESTMIMIISSGTRVPGMAQEWRFDRKYPG